MNCTNITDFCGDTGTPCGNSAKTVGETCTDADTFTDDDGNERSMLDALGDAQVFCAPCGRSYMAVATNPQCTEQMGFCNRQGVCGEPRETMERECPTEESMMTDESGNSMKISDMAMQFSAMCS